MRNRLEKAKDIFIEGRVGGSSSSDLPTAPNSFEEPGIQANHVGKAR
jgi:hypothetical protein